MSIPSDRSGSRPRSRLAAGLPPITADGIVDAAIQLTVDHGLENWTVRQLAAAVDAYPYLVIIPCVALSLTMLAFNFIGDGLRDALDPRMRR